MSRTRSDVYTILNPSLALASGILREKWDGMGLGLKAMAEDINTRQGADVCNAHSLSRFLWAGTDINNGLRGLAPFNRMLVVCADYFGVSLDEINQKMNAEAIRHKVIADLGMAGIEQSNFEQALGARPEIGDDQMKIIRKWLAGKKVSQEFYRLIPDISAALNFLFDTDKYTPEGLKSLL